MKYSISILIIIIVSLCLAFYVSSFFINRKSTRQFNLQILQDRWQVFYDTTTAEITFVIPKLVVGQIYSDKPIKKISGVKIRFADGIDDRP